MDTERTTNMISFEDAANGKWYLSMRHASPKETLKVKFDDGKAYKFLGTSRVNIGDPVIIDYGGASSYKMGNVVDIEKRITIKRTHALNPLFTFTTDPGKTEIKKNFEAIFEMNNAEESCPYLDRYLDSFDLFKNNDRFRIVDHLVAGVLNAISVVAFPKLAGDKAVTKAKLFLAGEKSVPGFFFGEYFTASYFAASSDGPLAAETAETTFTGFYPGWKDDLLKCSVWESDELAEVEKEWDDREQAYYLYYLEGSDELENLFNNNDDFKKMTNELVFRSALSILIRGGFKNLLEAALSVQMPIKDFYAKLIEFAKDIGANECFELLNNTDYANKTFEKVAAPASVVKDSFKDFAIDDNVLKKYKGKDEVVTIPDGIKTIDKAAFDKNYTLQKVIMPDSVTAIKDAAFRNCSNLEEIVFSKKLSTLAPLAFASCSALKSIDLSNTKVKSIRKKCFLFCESLEEIQFPESLKTIQEEAFMRTSIKEYHFPASIEKISTSYNNFEDVTDVYFAGTKAVEFNSKALNGASMGESKRIHCKKGSNLWEMFKSQQEEMEAWNKEAEKYNITKYIIPELVEL